jgi:hypothetical protein
MSHNHAKSFQLVCWIGVPVIQDEHVFISASSYLNCFLLAGPYEMVGVDSYCTQLEKQVQKHNLMLLLRVLVFTCICLQEKVMHKDVNAKGQIQHQSLAMCIFFSMLKVHIEGGLNRFLQDKSIG